MSKALTTAFDTQERDYRLYAQTIVRPDKLSMEVDRPSASETYPSEAARKAMYTEEITQELVGP